MVPPCVVGHPADATRCGAERARLDGTNSGKNSEVDFDGGRDEDESLDQEKGQSWQRRDYENKSIVINHWNSPLSKCYSNFALTFDCAKLFRNTVKTLFVDDG